MSLVLATLEYRSDVDGLRAVAVLPVLLFHAGFAGLSGGYVGVDVFFVISGFLITSILQAELEAGKFSIVRFYERRVRRLAPSLAVPAGKRAQSMVQWWSFLRVGGEARGSGVRSDRDVDL